MTPADLAGVMVLSAVGYLAPLPPLSLSTAAPQPGPNEQKLPDGKRQRQQMQAQRGMAISTPANMT